MPKFGETSTSFSAKNEITQKLVFFKGSELSISENENFTSFYEIKETMIDNRATLIIECGNWKFSIYNTESYGEEHRKKMPEMLICKPCDKENAIKILRSTQGEG